MSLGAGKRLVHAFTCTFRDWFQMKFHDHGKAFHKVENFVTHFRQL